MGWTYTRGRVDLEKAKQQHLWDATRYGAGIKAELLAHEWKPHTFFAIIRLTYPADMPQDSYSARYAGQTKTWLRIDLIDTAGGVFGYKDGSEEMGMYQGDKPSRTFAAEIYKHIPSAEGYGIEWRARNGVKHDDVKQMELIS